jgi:hypothetical protein
MKISHDMTVAIPQKSGTGPLLNLTSTEKSGLGIFGKYVYHRGCGVIENSDGGLFNVRQVAPRQNFTGLADDTATAIGKMIEIDKTGNDQKTNYSDDDKSILAGHCSGSFNGS